MDNKYIKRIINTYRKEPNMINQAFLLSLAGGIIKDKRLWSSGVRVYMEDRTDNTLSCLSYMALCDYIEDKILKD